MLQSQQEQQDYLKNYWAIFKRRCWLIFLTPVLMVGLAAFYLTKIPNQYVATTVVMPATSSGGGGLSDVGALWLFGSMGNMTTNEIEVIKGRELAERVVENMKLAKKEDTSELEWRMIVSGLQGKLGVKQKSGTNLIEITATSGSPQEAEKIANGVAVAYISLSNDSKREAWEELESLLEVKLGEVENALEESKQRLYNYAKQAGITTAFGPLLFSGQYAITEVPQAVAGIEANIMQMEIELEGLRKSLSDENPSVVSLRHRIAASREKLQQEKEKAIEKYNKQFGLTSVAAEVAFKQQLYSVLVAKQQELKAQYMMQSKSSEIVEEALEPLSPSSPNRTLILMMGAVLGVFVGLGSALLLEYVDNSMHNAGDVERFIGLPVLGRIPRLRGVKNNPGSDTLITYNGANSHRRAWIREFYKESYRMLQLEVMAVGERLNPFRTGHSEGSETSGNKNPRGLTLLVTSSVTQEGKSIVAANLAISISQTGRKVLLVDADCRRPVQHEILGLDTTVGLTDILMGKATWDEAVKKASIDDLSVIVSGREGGQTPAYAGGPSTILGSLGLEDFISLSRKEFDVVIFDSPPAALASESVAIGSKVDGVVLVIKAGATKKDVILRAREMIQNSGGNILGVALNFASPEKRGYKYYCR